MKCGTVLEKEEESESLLYQCRFLLHSGQHRRLSFLLLSRNRHINSCFRWLMSINLLLLLLCFFILAMLPQHLWAEIHNLLCSGKNANMFPCFFLWRVPVAAKRNVTMATELKKKHNKLECGMYCVFLSLCIQTSTMLPLNNQDKFSANSDCWNLETAPYLWSNKNIAVS